MSDLPWAGRNWLYKIWHSLQWMGGTLGIALITVLLWFGKLSEGIWLSAFGILTGFMFAGRGYEKWVGKKTNQTPET